MASNRILDILATVALGVAVIVIVITPELLAAPNALAAPSAVIVAIAAAAALVGGRWSRRIALGLSVAGLVLTALWYWLASDGFGLGTPWYDDMAEAAILAVAFLIATVLIAISQRSDRTRVASRS